MYKVMVIEDNYDLCEEIITVLKKWNYDAYRVSEFKNITGEVKEVNPHIILLDINLPLYDGFYWCKEIRGFSKVPIIFLSSRDSNMDIVMGITVGGDDYVTKPFHSDILMAKISAQLRRTYDYRGEIDNTIEYNGIILSVSEGLIRFGDRDIELSKNELKILKVLFDNKGKIISREKIMMALWNDDQFISDNTLTVNINRLRNKLSDEGIKDLILTKKGMGYYVQ